MSDIQYWSKTHKKILRVQQSINGPYRVVSIPPEKAGSWYVSNCAITAWAHKHRGEAEAIAELQAYAAKNGLEEWRPEQ